MHEVLDLAGQIVAGDPFGVRHTGSVRHDSVARSRPLGVRGPAILATSRQHNHSSGSLARKLQLVHSGQIIIRVCVLDVPDPLEDGVEQRQFDARAARNLPD